MTTTTPVEFDALQADVSAYVENEGERHEQTFPTRYLSDVA